MNGEHKYKFGYVHIIEKLKIKQIDTKINVSHKIEFQIFFWIPTRSKWTGGSDMGRADVITVFTGKLIFRIDLERKCMKSESIQQSGNKQVFQKAESLLSSHDLYCLFIIRQNHIFLPTWLIQYIRPYNWNLTIETLLKLSTHFSDFNPF